MFPTDFYISSHYLQHLLLIIIIHYRGHGQLKVIVLYICILQGLCCRKVVLDNARMSYLGYSFHTYFLSYTIISYVPINETIFNSAEWTENNDCHSSFALFNIL